jgi:RNA polymerase sigma factor (sigma-70 family)
MTTERLRKALKHLHQVLHPTGGDALTDGQLLARFIASRDEAAFAALVRRHGPMVLGVCRRILRHTQDAEDAFQAAFLVLARKAASVVNRQAVGSWLYRVSCRIALEAKAINDKRRTRERQVEDMPHPEVGPNEPPDWRPLLDRELNLLPESYRAVIVTCDLEGRSRKEAARHLGLSEGTVSSRLARGRRLLAKRLSRYGVSLPGGVLAATMAEGAASAVPPSLVSATLLAVSGQGAISASINFLVKGALKTMLLTKLKLAVGTVMIVAALGASGLAYRAAGESPSAPVKAADKAPSAPAEKPSDDPLPTPMPPEEPNGGGQPPIAPAPAHSERPAPAIPNSERPAPAPAAGFAPETPRGALPPLKIVNKREVRLDFEVVKVGPSGLGGVDVYVTLNEGASWNKLPNELPLNWPAGADTHGPGPVRGSVNVQLSNEKVIYGFIVAVKSKAGLARPAPKAGEPPQVRVELDASAPQAQLFSPIPDPKKANALVLSWSASDRNLADNPITSAWAERKEGPWTLIGEQLPNKSTTGALPQEATGSYIWQLPDRMPSRVYLKLTTRDNAGNIAVAQADKPILIDLSVPETRNIVVAPSDTSR